MASRYALAIQHERGEPLDTAAAALRTACLTGFAQAAMSTPIELPSGGNLTLTAGDLDEAVAGLLTNGLVASNVNGDTVPAASPASSRSAPGWPATRTSATNGSSRPRVNLGASRDCVRLC